MDDHAAVAADIAGAAAFAYAHGQLSDDEREHLVTAGFLDSDALAEDWYDDDDDDEEEEDDQAKATGDALLDVIAEELAARGTSGPYTIEEAAEVLTERVWEERIYPLAAQYRYQFRDERIGLRKASLAHVRRSPDRRPVRRGGARRVRPNRRARARSPGRPSPDPHLDASLDGLPVGRSS